MSAARDELEVKARVPDVAALEASLARAGAVVSFRGEMADHRFDRGQALADRDEMLRLRVYRPAEGAPRSELGWKGPVGARGAYRHRAEVETAVGDADAALELVQRLGFAETQRIERTVTVYHLESAILRIERYPDMDVLLEVEGEPEAIERAIRVTGLPRGEFRAESLPEFVARFEARTGRRARLAR